MPLLRHEYIFLMSRMLQKISYDWSQSMEN